jgi:mono/diheme cytochrome c family protein
VASDSRDDEQHVEEQHTDPLRHPVQAAEHEAEHLRRIVDEGKSEATPAILIGTWIAFVVPLVAIVIAIAFGTAYLITGNAGTAYPRAPATTTTGTTTQTGAAAGRSIFADNCSPCHGPTGHGGIGPDLTTLPAARDPSVVVHQVTKGGGGMPPFKGSLSPQQIEQVAAFVTQVIAKKAGS